MSFSHAPATRSPSEVEGWEEHLRLAQEAGEVGTWEWDLSSGRMRWSAQMFRNLGLSPGAADGGESYGLLLAAAHPQDRDRVAAWLTEFRGRPGPIRMEFRLAPASGAATADPNRGDPNWIVFLGNVIADGQGRPVRMLGITLDSTRRRKTEQEAEAALRESERRLRELNEQLERLAEQRARQLHASRAQIQAIFDNSPDWLTLFRATADGRFVYADMNKATERGYGLGRDLVIGRPLEEILGTEQARLPLQHMRECVRTGVNQRYTARRTLAGVTRSIDVMFVRVPEKHDGDWFLMATARDITEREAMEQQLLQAQKMEAVGQLTGGIAHDFNNLLTAIIGNIELLLPRLGTDATARRYVDAAQRAAENGARLTEQLLAFSRRQHLRPCAVDLNAVVAGMRDLLSRTIGTTIAVRALPGPELWPALVDPTQIEIAILNLAINARDAMPCGGTLSIETANLGAAEAPGEMRGRDCVAVTVRDTGSGMTEDVLRSAVEPFFTTKEPGKGSGLGLSQVYGMVQQSNGAMQIESRLGAGTAVRLYLPRAAPQAVVPEAARSPVQATDGGGHILVVDDDPAVREITVQMLRQSGYGVAEAESGQVALDALGRGEVYDLVAIDIAMPGLSGIETMARARQRLPGLRALYITGYADAAVPQLDTGGEPVLKKPFRLSDLRNAIRDALKRRRPDHETPAPLQRAGDE